MTEVTYPTYRYSRGGASVRVENEQEDRALKGEWFDHPPTEKDIDDRFTNVPDPIDEMISEEEAHEQKHHASRAKKKKNS